MTIDLEAFSTGEVSSVVTKLNSNFDAIETIVNSLETTVNNLYSNYFNVKDYGAVGDGVNDDTSAFEDAIAAASSGGIVHIPNPSVNYLLSSTLTIPSYVSFIGENEIYTKIISTVTSAPAIIINGAYGRISDFYIEYDSQRTNSTEITLQLGSSSSANQVHQREIKNIRAANGYHNFGNTATTYVTDFNNIYSNLQSYNSYSYGFFFKGLTSTVRTFINCWTLQDGLGTNTSSKGFSINNCTNLIMINCATDKNEDGFDLALSSIITFNIDNFHVEGSHLRSNNGRFIDISSSTGILNNPYFISPIIESTITTAYVILASGSGKVEINNPKYIYNPRIKSATATISTFKTIANLATTAVLQVNNSSLYHPQWLTSILTNSKSSTGLNKISYSDTDPTAGTYVIGQDIIYSNTQSVGNPIGRVPTTSGTMGTLNGGATTGTITTGTKSLVVNSTTDLTVGDYITIAGVSGTKYVTNISTSVNTTVNSDSASAGTILYVASTSSFVVGNYYVVGQGTAREEIIQVDTVGTGLINTCLPLTYTHTASDADSVKAMVYINSAASASVTDAAVAFSSAIFSTFGTINLQGSATWNPGSLNDGVGETSSGITVTGAALGDFVLVSAPYDLQGITCNGYVSATNTVTIRLQNETGGTIDLASGTWKVKVIKA